MLFVPLNLFAEEEEHVVQVGTPFNVQHNIHVDFDSVTGFVVGLPTLLDSHLILGFA